MLCPIFFFSSRRRHTRSKRDWSSDVCSSDLARRDRGRARPAAAAADRRRSWRANITAAVNQPTEIRAATRSEERRVGKECRSRGSAHHEKKKKTKERLSIDLRHTSMLSVIKH